MKTLDQVLEALEARMLPDGRTWLDLARAASVLEGVNVLDVIGRSRTRSVARARQRAWYELYADTSTAYSYPEIGAVWDRDHTTVIDGVRAHELRLFARAA